MTREQAIQILKQLQDDDLRAYCPLFVKPNSERRDWEQKAIEKWNNEINAFYLAIAALRQPEQKKGKWINMGTYCVCSLCQHTEPPQYDGVQLIPNFTPYCSMCGAKMGGRRMTREEEAIMNLSYILVEYPETSARGKAVLTAIEALAKMEAIQYVVDMPALWEQDDRRRYTKIVDIVRKGSGIKDASHPFADDVLMGGD